MNIVRLVLTIALPLYSSFIYAQAYTVSLSASVGDGSYAGAMPVGIAANPLLRDALQAARCGLCRE